MNRCGLLSLIAVTLSFTFGYPATAAKPPRLTASSVLADYVQAPDDSYSYTVRQRVVYGDSEVVELTLTSQTWRDLIWRHRLFICKPAKITNPSQGLLVVAGGSWNEADRQPLPANEKDLPGRARAFFGLAEKMGSPVAILMNVPRQPIFDGRHEDGIIAYTFDQYLNTGESDWPLLLPMVKSTVRAMDAVQDFVGKTWSVELKNFTVTGGSKRGWTTWLTSAVDDRVNAIAPMVIDMLNLHVQTNHQIEAWGKFSEMIRVYVDTGVIERFGEPIGYELRRIVDPYAYRDAMTMPKLIVLGTNDPYWTVDALNFYWDGLVGDKRILYIPNAGHGLETGLPQVFAGVAATHLAAAGKLEMASPAWSFEETEDGLTLHVTSDQKPKLVQSWSTSTKTQDFRKSQWQAQTLIATDSGYVCHLPRPKQGHAAMFVELIYQASDLTYNLSTQLQVVAAAPRN